MRQAPEDRSLAGVGCEVGAALLGTGTLQGSSAEWSCPDGYVAVVVFSPTKKKLKDVSVVWLVRMHCEEEFLSGS